MSPIVVIAVAFLALGAVARVTRFLNSDALIEGWREGLETRLGEDHKLVTLLGCPWCASIWIAGVIVPLAWWHGTETWFALPAAWLTCSYVYGLIAQNLDA